MTAVTPSTQQSPQKPYSYFTGNVTFPYMICIALTFAGYNAVEAISSQMVQLTSRTFTANAVWISVIISLNAVFGFVAQPYVAWKSDHTLTRFGRRRPYLFLGYGVTLLSILSLASLPYLIQGDARSSWWALCILIVINVSMQMFQDVTGGAMEPFMGDTFKQHQLGRAVMWRNYATVLVNVSIGVWAMRYSKTHPWIPYTVCCAWLVQSLLWVTFVIRERPMEVTAPRAPYNPIKHLGLLRNGDYLRVATISSLGLVLPAVFTMFNVLFVTSQLSLTAAEFANTNIIGPVAMLLCAWPVGFIVDRFGPKYSMSFGFVLLTICSFGMAAWAHDFRSVFICMTLSGASGVFIWGSMSSMVFQYAAQKERGTVFGLVQFVRAFSRFAATILLGFVVQYSVSYEPTPFMAEDFKKTSEFAKKMVAPVDPVSQMLQALLSSATKELLQKPLPKSGDTSGISKALAQDLNKAMHEKSLYNQSTFANVEMSRQSRALLKKPNLTAKETFILNRSLVADAYPVEIAKKLNYRATYWVTGFIGIFAFLLVATSRRGKYAKTIREADLEDFD